jgi:hypothetical protein
MTRAPFMAWTETPAGLAAVQEVTSRIRFSLLGKARTARRRLWRQLTTAARDRAVVEAVDFEVQGYLGRLGELAYAHGLPRVALELRRLVIVPCVLANGDMWRGLEQRLTRLPAFTSLEGGEPLREFFILTIIQDLAAAVASAGPSPKHPLASGDAWITVGLKPELVWRVPVLDEPDWNGHYYVLELTRAPITRALRKAATTSIEELEAWLPTLSRVERHDILRQARHVA